MFCLSSLAFAQEGASGVASDKKAIYVIPIHGPIDKTQLYIVRRGLKQAVQDKIDGVILDIDTPGGEMKVMLDLMEALKNFKGETMTFVNKEAISAGAYISASTNKIYFHPQGILGAAAVVQGTGQDIPSSMKEKIDSYLRARVRSMTQEYRYRADVVRAMMDDEFVVKIGEEVIKEKGELLTLTAQEAVKQYGDPKESLLGEAIVGSVEELLDLRYGKGNYNLKTFQVTWSEELSKWLSQITPVLMGLGLLLLFIEFKTPGFGVFGISGIALLLVVFGSSYVAGLSGSEGVAVFILGLLFIAVELFIFPGIVVFGALGFLMVIGSLVWSLADIWPNKEFEITGDLFIVPLVDVAIGLIIAIVGIFIVGRFLLKSWLWDAMILEGAVAGRPLGSGASSGVLVLPEEGDVGVAVTDLHPLGQIEIDGKRYEAQVKIGSLSSNTLVKVIGRMGFSLIVEEMES